MVWPCNMVKPTPKTILQETRKTYKKKIREYFRMDWEDIPRNTVTST